MKLLKTVEWNLLFIVVILSIVLTILNPKFARLENIFDVLRNISFMGIFALGELVVLISGGIDVSFTAVATVSQYIMGMILSTHYKTMDNIIIPIVITLAVGTVLGFVNAILVHYTRVHPVIITISTLNVFYGLLIFATGGKWIYRFPRSFRQFAKLKLITLVNERGIEYGLSVFIVFWICAAFLTWFILKYTTIGRKIYAFGGNPEAAHRVGFSSFKIHVFVYCYMGMLAGLASFVHAQLTQMIQPNALVGKELEVLAATILGGASVFGGTGSVWGVILGVILLGFVKNGLILLKVPAYWHQVAIGTILVIAAGVTVMRKKSAEGKTS